MARREITITKFKPDPVRKFTANVTHASGVKITADFQYGSWQATVKENGVLKRKEVLPHVAAILSSKLPKGKR